MLYAEYFQNLLISTNFHIYIIWKQSLPVSSTLTNQWQTSWNFLGFIYTHYFNSCNNAKVKPICLLRYETKSNATVCKNACVCIHSSMVSFPAYKRMKGAMRTGHKLFDHESKKISASYSYKLRKTDQF